MACTKFVSHNSVGFNWSGLEAVLLNLLSLGSTALIEKNQARSIPL
jgi:hypothetical protein